MIDVVVVGLFVACAVGYLLWNLVNERKPPCHPPAGKRKDATPEGSNVILGASLARGLKRAQARR